MNQSEKIDLLATALCEFQKEIKPAPKDSENPFFKSKYTDLATLTEHISPFLTKHGLSVSQICEGDCSVTTILMHTSGQFVSGTLTLKPSKDDPQGRGSAITYARRYGLGAITGTVTEEDDDGNGASTPPKPKGLTQDEKNILEAVKQESDVATTKDDLRKIYQHHQGKFNGQEISKELWEEIKKYVTNKSEKIK